MVWWLSHFPHISPGNSSHSKLTTISGYLVRGSDLPLRVFAAICALLSAAPISLRSAVHGRVHLRVGVIFAVLQGSGDRAVPFLLRQRGAASLAPHAAYTPCGPMVVFVYSPSSLLGFSATFHGLKLGEGHYVRFLGPMPDCAATGGVVVIKATTVGVKQLPPLVTVCLSNRNTWRGIPATFTCGQIHIHAFTGAWLQDLHPIRAEWEETRVKSYSLKTATDRQDTILHWRLESKSTWQPVNNSHCITGWEVQKCPLAHMEWAFIFMFSTCFHPYVCVSSDVISRQWSHGRDDACVCSRIRWQVDTLSWTPGLESVRPKRNEIFYCYQRINRRA